MKITIAIDGPAAAGKGTISRAVAKTFGFAHLDTGLLYRAVGLKALEKGRGVIDPTMAGALALRLTEADTARTDLRSSIASRAASKVAVLPEVRAALLAYQQNFALRDGGAVLDGRDIGTVICPDADVKIYVTASDDVRAQRRYDELTAAGAETSLAAVLHDIRQRDARDSERTNAPLARADDAHLLDTSELSIDAAVAEAVALIKTRVEQGRD